MKGAKEEKVYLIGIGGIGMSALARWYKINGKKVAGYDKTSTPLTQQLIEEGIEIHFEDNIEKIPADFKEIDTLIIYTPAVPKEHQELIYFQNNGNRVIKRSEALGDITNQAFTIAIAGTHGKTTTSSMVAHILRHAGKNCFAFLGGITQNYKTNILFGEIKEERPIMVVEADEYDRSFLRLNPDIAVVTAVDPDHLDIYKDEKDFIMAFNDFIKKVKSGGSVVLKHDLMLHIPENVTSFTFGDANADFSSELVSSDFVFNIKSTLIQDSVNDIALPIPGFHNIQNALAAFAAARKIGIPAEVIKEALQSFKGVKRRFEYLVKSESMIYIDDYAHHPTEISAVLQSLKVMYPFKKITVIFQPHLFSRTKDFMEEFASSLSIATCVVLLDIYPARESPIPGITSEVLLHKIESVEKKLLKKEEILPFLKSENVEVLVTMGAGDVDQWVQPIAELLTNKLVEL